MKLTMLAVGVLVVAAAATTGDFVWYSYGVRHRMTAGLLHGALLLTVVGAVLGAASGRLVRGLPIGMMAGISGAASYYAIIAIFGGRTYGAAIPAAWILLWLMLAALDGRWLRTPPRSWMSIGGRGLVAAVLGGIAFSLVITGLWGRPPAVGRNYVVQYLLWVVAWAPGLAALMLGRSGSGQSAVSGDELRVRMERGDTLHILDVRSQREFALGHVPGAVNVPFTQINGRLSDVPGAPGDELIVYCGHGPRALIAAGSLQRHGGRRVVHLRGHWAGWLSRGLPVERADD